MPLAQEAGWRAQAYFDGAVVELVKDNIRLQVPVNESEGPLLLWGSDNGEPRPGGWCAGLIGPPVVTELLSEADRIRQEWLWARGWDMWADLEQEERGVLIAYLRTASALVEATDQLRQSTRAWEDVERAHRAFEKVQADMGHLSPIIRSDVEAMDRQVQKVYETARTWSSTMQALQALDDKCHTGDTAAVRANYTLRRLRATNPPPWNPRLAAEEQPHYARLLKALHAVPSLGPDQIRDLLNSPATIHDHESHRQDALNDYRQARQALIESAKKRLIINTSAIGP